MKMEKYIADLLYRYQCVTVPSFGAFLGEIQSAQLIENQNTFYPPKKVISFNVNIKMNDGLLVNYVAQKEQISYENALHKVSNQVQLWQDELKGQDYLLLEKIGEFFQNSEGNLVFKADSASNFATESFGLSSFSSPEIERELKIDNLSSSVENLVLNDENLDDIPVVAIQEDSTSSNWLKYAAAIAIFGGLTSGVYFYYQNQFWEQQENLIQANVEKKVQQKIQEATFVLPIVKPTTAKVIDTTFKIDTISKSIIVKPYHIIAGAFKNEMNAKNMAEQLMKEGYEAHVLPLNRHNLYPVVYQSFQKLKEAQEFQLQLKEEKNIEAWLKID